MKKILIPTDFSLNSYQTIDYIVELFKNEHCEFYFLNTFTYDVNSLNAIELLQADDEWYDKPKQESLRLLGKIVERYIPRKNTTNHSFNAISDCIDLTEGIVVNVEKIGIDLVILTGKPGNKISKNTGNTLERVRCCPILIVPPHASICKSINLTIASNFKQKINTLELYKFIKVLENTNIEIEILVLEKENTLDIDASNNLEVLIDYLSRILNKSIGLKYISSSFCIKDYAQLNLSSIMCIIDRKPDLFRKIGLLKSNIIPILKQIRGNTVLTIHQ
nr:hypothetical protein [uncultured Psychroserpens sp.]